MNFTNKPQNNMIKGKLKYEPTSLSVRGEKLFEHQGIIWMMRETLYREGQLKGMSHIEIYDPMNLEGSEFQIYLMTNNLDDFKYLNGKNRFAKETIRDIQYIYA